MLFLALISYFDALGNPQTVSSSLHNCISPGTIVGDWLNSETDVSKFSGIRIVILRNGAEIPEVVYNGYWNGQECLPRREKC